MKLRQALLVVMLAVGCSVLMLGNMASAEQEIAKDTERSQGAYAVPDCCQKKEAKGEGQGQSTSDHSSCENHEGSHNAGHEGSCGEEKAEEGSH